MAWVFNAAQLEAAIDNWLRERGMDGADADAERQLVKRFLLSDEAKKLRVHQLDPTPTPPTNPAAAAMSVLPSKIAGAA